MGGTRALTAAIIGSACIAGCSTPFARRTTDIDWAGRPAPGTITVSDPKMYRREALINDRRDEVAWLDQLLIASRTLEFKPEIVREIEQITAISAALGLKFDPAAGAGYRRGEEMLESIAGAPEQEREAELGRSRTELSALRDALSDLPGRAGVTQVRAVLRGEAL